MICAEYRQVIVVLGQSQAAVEKLRHSLACAEAEAADSKQALRDMEKSIGMFFLSQVGFGTVQVGRVYRGRAKLVSLSMESQKCIPEEKNFNFAWWTPLLASQKLNFYTHVQEGF